MPKDCTGWKPTRTEYWSTLLPILFLTLILEWCLSDDLVPEPPTPHDPRPSISGPVEAVRPVEAVKPIEPVKPVEVTVPVEAVKTVEAVIVPTQPPVPSCCGPEL